MLTEEQIAARRLKDLFNRKEDLKSKLEQAKGRYAELERRVQEERQALQDLGVTPETAEEVLSALENEINECLDTATKLVEAIEDEIRR